MSPVLFYLRNVISKQFCQTHYDSLLLYVTLLDELFSQANIHQTYWQVYFGGGKYY